MTAQIFFITSAATNVVRVPVGALNFKDTNNLLGLTQNNTESTDTTPGLVSKSETPNIEKDEGDRVRARPEGLPSDFSDLSPEQVARFRERRAANGGRSGGPGGGTGRIRGEGRPTEGQRSTERTALSSSKSTVLVVNTNGAIESREITIGVTTRISAEVLNGLTVGEQVVAGIIQARAEPAQNGTPAGVGGLGGGGGRRF